MLHELMDNLNILYKNYGKTSDEDLKSYLGNTKIIFNRKGDGEFYEYNEEILNKIKKRLREVSTIWETATEKVVLDVPLEFYKEIHFLCKNTSPFFLYPDIGEVFDQISETDIKLIRAIEILSESYRTMPNDKNHYIIKCNLYV